MNRSVHPPKKSATLRAAILARRAVVVPGCHDALSARMIESCETELAPIPELASMGVGRVSIPVASILATHKSLMDFFRDLKASPTGLLEGQTHRLSTFGEFLDFVGLKEYRRMEEEFLPKENVERKYK